MGTAVRMTTLAPSVGSLAGSIRKSADSSKRVDFRNEKLSELLEVIGHVR